MVRGPLQSKDDGTSLLRGCKDVDKRAGVPDRLRFLMKRRLPVVECIRDAKGFEIYDPEHQACWQLGDGSGELVDLQQAMEVSLVHRPAVPILNG